MPGEKGSALFERGRALTVGQKAIGTDSYEVAGQHVEEEAACEFVGVELHRAVLTGMGVIFPGEGDRLLIDGEEAVVGNGDAVGISSEILEGLRGPAERRLGVNGPVMASGLAQETIEGCGILVEPGQVAMEVQTALVVSGPCESEPFATENAAQHANGQEEATATGHPAGVVGGEPAGRHEAVDVRMMKQRLPPGVKDGEEPDPGTEMARIRGHFEKGLGGSAEEQAVQNARILERKRREPVRQCEYHVCVRHGQEHRALLLEPVRGGRGLALRAVAIAAGIVRDDPVPARIALVDVTPECGGPAGKQTLDDAPLIAAESRPACRGFRQPEDLRDLVSRSRPHREAVASGCRSSGLRMLRRRNPETCV